MFNQLIFKKNKLNFIFWTFLYRVLLDFCFYIYISPLWVKHNYGTYTYSQFNIFIYILSWFFLFVSLFYFYSWYDNNYQFSSLVLLFIYYISFIPFTTMMGFSVFTLLYIVLNLLYFTFLKLFHWFFSSIKFSKIYYRSINDNILPIITLLIVLGVSIYFGNYSNFRIDLNIFEAYTYREKAGSYSYPFYMTYLLGLSRILIPFGIVYFIKTKRLIFLSIILISAAINYSFDGGKTLLLTSFVALIIGKFFNKKYLKLIPTSFFLLMFIGFIDYFFYSELLFRLVIRRLFFVPNLINSYFYKYILNHKPNYFSQLLRFLGIESNSININYYIGDVYFNVPQMSANSGLIADALWQLGYLGIFILPFIISFILVFIDKTSSGVPEILLIIPALVTAYYLNNSSITAAMFSHGILVFSVLFILYPKERSLYEA